MNRNPVLCTQSRSVVGENRTRCRGGSSAIQSLPKNRLAKLTIFGVRIISCPPGARILQHSVSCANYSAHARLRGSLSRPQTCPRGIEPLVTCPPRREYRIALSLHAQRLAIDRPRIHPTPVLAIAQDEFRLHIPHRVVGHLEHSADRVLPYQGSPLGSNGGIPPSTRPTREAHQTRGPR